MKITKEMVLDNIEQVKQFISEIDNKKEEKVLGIAIQSRFGGVKFQSTKTTFKEAVIEGKANLIGADLSNADLIGADLRGADLSNANLIGADLSNADLIGADLRGADFEGAELNCAKFYGRGGTKVIKKANLKGFLGALGFIIE